MQGWCARIGLILPADNAVTEPELVGLGIGGVSYHGYRLTTTEPGEMRSEGVALASASQELGLDTAAYVCGETSADCGLEAADGLAQQLTKAAGVPVATATGAMLLAVGELGIRSLALVSPYAAHSAKRYEDTLGEAGLRVVSRAHRDFSAGSDDTRVWYETNRQPASVAYRMARGLNLDDADGILIAGTNLATFPMIALLEHDTQKPVITSNQAILWWCLQSVGVRPGVRGHGRLLEDQ